MKHIILLLLFAASTLVCNSQVQRVSFIINGGIQDEFLKKKIETNTTKLLLKLNEAFAKGIEMPQFDEKVITSTGIEKILSLWKDSHFYCVAERISENVLQKDNYYQIRNLPFIFGNSDKFDIVIEYMPDGRIDDFYIGLEAHQYKTVLDNTSVIDQTRREIILNFLENLRTSYIKKDIDYIGKLYSDKALIITGKVLKVENIPTDHIQPTLTKNQIEYQVSTKAEYIARLQSVFRSISYLRLDFKDIKVEKHRKYPNFYGISLQQTWDTQKYKDDGLLFLLVQFKDNEDPIIWVRTWQDALNTPSSDVFGFHNFKISSGDSVK
jgi:hypothetical protein